MINAKTKSIIFLLSAVSMLSMLSVSYSEAAPVIRSGDAVTLPDDKVVPGDFYVFGGHIISSGVVEGDFYTAGGSVTVNGPIEGDLVIGAGTVSLHGDVEDDVRIAAGQVVVADHIKGDLVVFGGTLSVLSTALVEGDIVYTGEKVDIEGDVGGSIRISADHVFVNSSVSGDATVTARRHFVLGQRANIRGNISYKSSKDLDRHLDAVVVGDILKEEVEESPVSNTLQSLPLVHYLASLFAALAALLLFGSRLEVVTKEILSSLGLHGIIGFGFLILTPIASAVLMVSMLGALIGAIVLLLYAHALLVSTVLSGVIVGAFIAKLVKKKYIVSWLWTVIGVSVVHALLFVPVIGYVFLFVVMLIVIGGLCVHYYKKIR